MEIHNADMNKGSKCWHKIHQDKNQVQKRTRRAEIESKEVLRVMENRKESEERKRGKEENKETKERS